MILMMRWPIYYRTGKTSWSPQLQTRSKLGLSLYSLETIIESSRRLSNSVVAKAPAIPFTTVLYVSPPLLSRTWAVATVANTPTIFKQLSIAATVPHANCDYFYHSMQESLLHHWQILYSNIVYIRICNHKYSGIDYEPSTIWVWGLEKIGSPTLFTLNWTSLGQAEFPWVSFSERAWPKYEEYEEATIFWYKDRISIHSCHLLSTEKNSSVSILMTTVSFKSVRASLSGITVNLKPLMDEVKIWPHFTILVMFNYMSCTLAIDFLYYVCYTC